MDETIDIEPDNRPATEEQLRLINKITRHVDATKFTGVASWAWVRYSEGTVLSVTEAKALIAAILELNQRSSARFARRQRGMRS